MPQKTTTCKCMIDGLEEEARRWGEPPSIRYCALHQAAPAMLAALKIVWEGTSDLEPDAADAVEKVLATATGGKE